MGYTVHGILQARILEWVAFPFSRGSFQRRDQTQVSYIAGRFFTSWATREEEAEWEVTEESVFLPSFLLSDNFSFQLCLSDCCIIYQIYFLGFHIS